VQEEYAVIDVDIRGTNLENAVERIGIGEDTPHAEKRGSEGRSKPTELPRGRFACWIAA
jgi:hypothetical protein